MLASSSDGHSCSSARFRVSLVGAKRGGSPPPLPSSEAAAAEEGVPTLPLSLWSPPSWTSAGSASGASPD
eukprot:3593162-Pyramimonas_sp.AAC.1